MMPADEFCPTGPNPPDPLPLTCHLIDMSNPPMLRKLLTAGLLVLIAVLAAAAWVVYAPPGSGDGWTWEVYRANTEQVSTVALLPSGGLLYSLEHTTRGRMIEVSAAGDTQRTVLDGLKKPDGLAAFAGGLAISQESSDSPVVWMSGNERRNLFTANSVEGIAADGEVLYAVEDLKSGGRLIRFDNRTGKLETLRENLLEAEGVARCPDGKIYYTEKALNWVKRYRPEQKEDPVVVSGLNKPGALTCTAQGLWISEDATNFARLVLAQPDGSQQTILSRLHSPQMLLPLDDHSFLLAEQGRNRVLRLTRTSR